MPRVKTKKVQFSTTSELFWLRALLPTETDFDRDLEQETWCRLHPDLPDKYGLLFLVRKIEKPLKAKAPYLVTVGGIRVINTLVVDNDSKSRIDVDNGIDPDTIKEFDCSTDENEQNGNTLYLVRRIDQKQDQCRVQIELQVGDWFEFQFDYLEGESWGGHVELVEVDTIPALGDEPAHLAARFEVSFDILYHEEEGDEDEEEEQ